LGCRNLPPEIERYVKCRWETTGETAERLVCNVQVRALDRLGLVSDISGRIAGQRLYLSGISTKRLDNPGESLVTFGLEVPDLFRLADMIRKLERIPGVIEVRRVS
jgi:GTP pyrophosphokinase